jgi:hypothetical protein
VKSLGIGTEALLEIRAETSTGAHESTSNESVGIFNFISGLIRESRFLRD